MNNDQKMNQKSISHLIKIITDYLSENQNEKINNYHSIADLKKKVNLSLPEKEPQKSKLDLLKREIDTYLKYAVKTNHHRFNNQLFSGFSLPAFIGEVLTTLTNTSMYTYEVSPLATLMEKEVIKEMASLSGFKKYDGTFVTGGSNSNLVALLAARNFFDKSLKVQGYWKRKKPLVLFVSEVAHYSFEKAVNILGLGLDNIVKVKSNAKGQMDSKALEQEILSCRDAKKEPFFVAATAGTTVLGAFDNITKINEVCKKHNLWLHVDGAWGGSVLLSKKHSHLLKGLEKADSFTWDAHKMMGVPLMCSVVLFNRQNILKPLNDISGADYIFHNKDDDEVYDLGEISLQCGRRVDVLKLWFAWQYYGRNGYAKRIDKLFDLAQYMVEKINKHSDFELIAPVASLNVCFRYIPKDKKKAPMEEINKINLEIREKLLQEGKWLVNYSIIKKKVFFRFIVVNFDLTKKHVNEFLKAVVGSYGG